MVKSGGPMNIADYMSLALVDPDFGYYTRGDPLGTQGDFITSPEISQIFGELIGLWLAEQWQAMGRPPAILTELGPGRGTLMRDMLRATATIDGFHDAIEVHLVEASPVLREKQAKLLADSHPRLHWHTAFSDAPPKPLLLVANEFFDALPIRQFVRHAKGWQERVVSIGADNLLHFTLVPATPPPAVKGQMQAYSQIYEYSEAAGEIAHHICRRIDAHGGVALIVDYGYEGGSRGDTLQAVRSHRYHDPLVDPGTADLTAHVDFSRLARIAAAHKLAPHGPVPQGMFLSKLGAHVRAAMLCQNAADDQKASIISGLNRLLSLEQMGGLFKVFCITASDHARLEGF